MHRTSNRLRRSLSLLALLGTAAFGAFAQETISVIDALEAEPIPEYGAQPRYGFPLVSD